MKKSGENLKKVFVMFFIFVFFLMGLAIGGKNNQASELFEESKSKFENEITTPNNNYDANDNQPVDGMLNKLAKKIDQLIEKITKKFT